jgi:hypothetical protein
MIKIIDNYLTSIQCESITSLWDSSNVINITDDIYRFYGIDLIPHLKKVIGIIPKFKSCNFKKLRIQCTDESIIQVKTKHTHLNNYSFVIFLNSNYSGGRLIFDKIVVTPKIGSMVYFTKEESHRVENCDSARFTLVGFLHNKLFETKMTLI